VKSALKRNFEARCIGRCGIHSNLKNDYKIKLQLFLGHLQFAETKKNIILQTMHTFLKDAEARSSSFSALACDKFIALRDVVAV